MISQRSLKGMRRSDRYTLPPMPFSLSADEALALPDTTPGVNGAEEILLPVGRGVPQPTVAIRSIEVRAGKRQRGGPLGR